ncbi:MAG: Asp-tRNA(Asn)/Glu-tRNA(Gln) amidotransferase subunit GatA [Desulfurococcales archaeon]|nr:Asp-tRNA(Asn)/Glu-tRNA(Gln) amidotransferase subunit GatA [Desulfurococcales archaeon]
MRKLKTAYELVEAYRNGSLDPVEHAWRVIEEIGRWEGRVNAYITLEAPEAIIIQAEEARERYRRGEHRPLEGVLVAVKDNISTSFMPTTAASRMLEKYIPPFNATVVERLVRAGAIVVGKTNMDEFAMGSTSEFSAFGPVRNPWDLERVPGGSSGGSAACLAYGGCDLSLGSDTGGSIRLPAAYTATVGIKPTYGLVSRYGLIPYGNSLEQIGPMARSVKDAALLLEVIGGWDPRDSTSLRIDPPKLSNLEPLEPGEASLCVPREMVEGSEEPVAKVFWNLMGKLESEGFEVLEASLPEVSKALPAYYIIALAEAASNLARYDGGLYPREDVEAGDYWRHVAEARARGFGWEVKKRIVLGSYALSEGYRDEYYIAATKVRRLVRDAVLRLARKCIIASPAAPILPPRLGERITDPLLLYAMDVYTVVANLAGVPALAMPAGFSQGLPVGVQFMAYRLGEDLLVRLGLTVEEMTGLRGVAAGEG